MDTRLPSCLIIIIITFIIIIMTSASAAKHHPSPEGPDHNVASNGTDTNKVKMKTYVIWEPPKPDSESESDSEPSKLVILPLGAFIALIIATCIKASHWWNEDIREADGMLENVYTAKNPRRKVLARVLSVESDPRSDGGSSGKGAHSHRTLYGKYRRKSRVVPEDASPSPASPTTEGFTDALDTVNISNDIPMVPMGAPREACRCSQQPQDIQSTSNYVPKDVYGRAPFRQESFASMSSGTELIPLLPMYSVEQLKYQMDSPVLETTNVSFPNKKPYPSRPSTPRRTAESPSHKGKDRLKGHPCRKGSVRDKRPARRKRPNVNGPRKHGVSKLVLDSLSFNLHLMQLAVEEDLCKRIQQQQQQSGGGSSSSSPSHASTSPRHPGRIHLEHGYIEDSFIHPGEDHHIPKPHQNPDGAEASDLNSPSPSTENTCFSSSAQSSVASAPWSPVHSRPLSCKEGSNAVLTAAVLESISRTKPSVSSFSSFGTSSTSLSHSTASHLGDSRLFYHLARTSPVSSPEASGSDTLGENTSLKKSQTSTDITHHHQEHEGEGMKEGDLTLRGDTSTTHTHWKPKFSSLRRKDNCAERPVFFIV